MPADADHLEAVAAFLDATGRAADLPAARRFAEDLRSTAPDRYTAIAERVAADAAENLAAGARLQQPAS
ncbi:hypothetical protein ACFO1B_43965 [Dactylosporangium siamense]|uniref:Uncharacterized protein n=1 Tax=Dactylosporangium siamense TaxID=685454 RepID=A0A919UJZ5_9ACTN|nr:hypothetical protein [Dactylosporangium siamense]GIG53203.1 hypothetical protein Dsi01nite_112440 [Dactylosporangium siamense]